MIQSIQKTDGLCILPAIMVRVAGTMLILARSQALFMTPLPYLLQTMPKNIPLIYGGLEEPVLRALEFFEKDPIVFKEFNRVPFYKTLLSLRKRNPALAADASFRKVKVGDEKAVYAYFREKAGKRILVILNLSAKEQTIKVNEKSLWGAPYNIFIGKKEKLINKGWKIAQWGYLLYEYLASASVMIC